MNKVRVGPTVVCSHGLETNRIRWAIVLVSHESRWMPLGFASSRRGLDLYPGSSGVVGTCWYDSV